MENNGTTYEYFRFTNGNPKASLDDPRNDPPPRDREPAFRRGGQGGGGQGGGGQGGGGQGWGERVFLLVASAISAAAFWIIA